MYYMLKIISLQAIYQIYLHLHQAIQVTTRHALTVGENLILMQRIVTYHGVNNWPKMRAKMLEIVDAVNFVIVHCAS